MLRDLILKNSSGDLLGYAKIDVSNDIVNIDQKQVNVNDISFVPTEDEDIKLLQEKVERNMLPMNYLFKDMHDKFITLGVEIELEGVVFTTTTTTISPSTTTTTTTAP